MLCWIELNINQWQKVQQVLRKNDSVVRTGLDWILLKVKLWFYEKSDVKWAIKIFKSVMTSKTGS
jgi:hypothetical protein